MPSTSAKQAVAMQIAAAGKSNIGIPQSVGKEFVAADAKQPGKKFSRTAKKLYPKHAAKED